MLKQPITILVQASIVDPTGTKRKPGQIVTLEDDPYVRLLIKSGTVVLIDPPSLDPEFLQGAGYEKKEGHDYYDLEEGFITELSETLLPGKITTD